MAEIARMRKNLHDLVESNVLVMHIAECPVNWFLHGLGQIWVRADAQAYEFVAEIAPMQGNLHDLLNQMSRWCTLRNVWWIDSHRSGKCRNCMEWVQIQHMGENGWIQVTLGTDKAPQIGLQTKSQRKGIHLSWEQRHVAVLGMCEPRVQVY